MRTALIAATMIAVVSTSSRAEFLLQATPSAPAMMPRQLMPFAHRMALPVRRPPPPKPLAEGFGRDVPLAFAVRQILPDGVEPQIAAGVDPDAKVNWTGGRPWDAVLAEAVRPLGVKLEATDKNAVLTR
jgi:hypothetical protein